MGGLKSEKKCNLEPYFMPFWHLSSNFLLHFFLTLAQYGGEEERHVNALTFECRKKPAILLHENACEKTM